MEAGYRGIKNKIFHQIGFYGSSWTSKRFHDEYLVSVYAIRK